MNRRTFHPHGEYTIEQRGYLMITRATNAWNKETSLAFVRDCKALIAGSIEPHRFYVLTCTKDWLPTHDSLEHLTEVTEWAITRGMRAQAFSFSTALEGELLTQILVPQELSHFTRKGFLDEQEARNWLKAIAESEGDTIDITN